MIKKIQLFVILLITAVSLYAQDPIPEFDYSNPEEYEIENIKIAGVKFLDHTALISISGLSEGDTISLPGTKITAALKKFWSQGLFSDVEINVTRFEKYPEGDVKGKVDIEIFLQERSRLAKIEWEGVKKSEQEDLEEKIALEKAKQVTDNKLANVKHIIKGHYFEKGFYNVDIDFKLRDDPEYQNHVVVAIKVDKKDKIKISEIEIEGNIALSDKKLRRLMKKTKQKKFINLKSTKFVEKTFKEDKKNLLAKYNEKGYRDAKILEDSIYYTSENRLNIYIKIYEGSKYYFGDINWLGNSKYSSEILNRALKISRGDVYDQALLDQRLSSDPDAVGNLYLDNGYLFYHCIPAETKISNDTINLEMRIFEGKQAKIRRVIINGNTKTKEHVARRELYTLPGELFSKDLIIRSVRELAQLGHFDPEKINPIPIPNPADGTVDIEYSLEEKPNDQVEISGGWGANMVVGTIGLSFNNFAIGDAFKKGAWRPVPSGDGQKLSLRAQTNGKYYQSYSVSFTEPWLGGKKPNSLSVSFSYSLVSAPSYDSYDSNSYNPYSTYNPYGSTYGYDNYGSQYQDYSFFDFSRYMKITGISVGFGSRLKWPDDYFVGYLGLSFQRYNLKDWQYIIRNGKINNINLSMVLSRKSSGPSPLYPTSGSDFTLSLAVTPPYSLFDGKDDYSFKFIEDEVDTVQTARYEEYQQDLYKFIEYHKWKFSGDWYLNVFDKFVLRSKIEFGYLGYFTKEKRSPIEGFDVGGDGMTYSYYGKDIIPLRGYENGALSPEAGGNMYNKYVVEFRYPFTQSPSATIFGMIFIEGGKAWTDFEDYNPFSVNRSAGVGVRIFLPMLGLMGLDWGYGFDAPYGSNEPNKGKLSFTLGQSF